jgi:hypothetical protein
LIEVDVRRAKVKRQERLAEGLVGGEVEVARPVPQGVDGWLLGVGEDVDGPLAGVDALDGRTGRRAPGREPALGGIVVQHRQANLFEVVSALRSTGGLARSLYGG